jgi:hypothetical protein
MTALLPRHRVLALAMLIVGVVSALAWLLVVRPQQRQAREGVEGLAEKRTSLRQRGWPLDQERLERLLAERTGVLDGDGQGQPGLKLRAEQVRQYATAAFRERVQSGYQSPEAFVRNASNIDFREAFNRLQRRLAGEGVWLAPEVLNLSEDSSVPYAYQLLLQVWTLERLSDLVLQNHLQVLADRTIKVRGASGDPGAARISMEPIVAYYLEEGSPAPYLLGIPVRLRLAGQVSDVRAFLLALTADGNFLPAMDVELYAEDPGVQRTRTPETGGMGRVELDITCSGFFAFPGGDAPAVKPAASPAKAPAPAGGGQTEGADGA